MLGYLQGCEKGGRKGGGEGRWTVKEKEGKGKSKDAKRCRHTSTSKLHLSVNPPQLKRQL